MTIFYDYLYRKTKIVYFFFRKICFYNNLIQANANHLPGVRKQPFRAMRYRVDVFHLEAIREGSAN
jgi:hypothetical protein